MHAASVEAFFPGQRAYPCMFSDQHEIPVNRAISDGGVTAIEKVRVKMRQNVTAGKTGRLSAAIVILSALLMGCQAPGQAPEPVDTSNLIWPKPPDQARISFVRSLSSEEELGGKQDSLKDILLGRKREEKGLKLFKPYGVHADRQGRVFVTDTGIGKVVVFDLQNRKVSRWGEKGGGFLRGPIGVTSDSRGRVYVTDAKDKRVVVFDRTGKFLHAWNPGDAFGRPTGIAVDDKRGRVYVADSKNHHIAVLDMRGARIDTIGKKGHDPGQFNFPTNLTVDPQGKLYVVDSLNHRIQIIGPDGKLQKAFGKNGDAPGNFARPRGIGVDSDGNAYVVDAAFNNFQIFNQDGQLLLFVGKAGFDPGEFNLPAGAYMDANDRLYVVDSLNARVQIFQYLKDKTAKKPAS